MKMDYDAVRTSFATGNPAAGEDLLGLIRIAVQGGNSRNSVRQVRCLLAAMEENRENLCVIVAGYTDEMNRFIASNPGLKSRFTKVIHFADYDGEELMQIFRSFAKGYTFGPGAEEEAGRICREMYDTRDSDFGNAREVRNLFDAVKAAQAARLSRVETFRAEDLSEFTRVDMLAAEERRARSRPPVQRPRDMDPIGFRP